MTEGLSPSKRNKQKQENKTMAELNFDSNTVDPRDSFAPLPNGWYQGEITKSESRQNKAGTGSYLQLEIKIMGPTHEGRIIWDRLNLNHPKENVVEIAQRTLSSICKATGVLTVKDSSELHGKPFAIKLKVRAETADFDASNDVKGYMPLSEQPIGAAPAATTSGAAPAATPNAAPWANR